jgi:dTDP-4-dehydrorhamnose reductase
MRILVTGASGFIGRTCLEQFGSDQVVGTFHSRPGADLVRADLLDAVATRRLVEELRPEAVVHCAARPSVDWCEQNPDAARRLNYEATLNVLDAARPVGARVAFISTDYVFDGEAGPYAEHASTRPINVYGRLKLESERAVLADSDRHLVARTTNVYGFDPQSKNFLMAILPTMARGEAVSVASDQYGTPTLVADLCSVIRTLLGRDTGGVFHVAGPDYLNRVEWALAAAAAFGLPPGTVRGAATVNLDQAARRPMRAGLLSARLCAERVEAPRSLADGLRAMVADRSRSPVQAW